MHLKRNLKKYPVKKNAYLVANTWLKISTKKDNNHNYNFFIAKFSKNHFMYQFIW